mgnify:CR=1 FL=1
MIYPGLNKLGKVIYVGAEAILILGEFLDIKSIYKIRLPKPYRDPNLDLLVRSSRTKSEARIILLARSVGINVPAILLVDVDLALIIMEYIEGQLLRDLLNNLNHEIACKLIHNVGAQVAKMHKAGIVHGDLTTSNMIYSNGKVYIIDFGLAKMSNALEDRGVDIHLFLRSLESVHFNIKDLLFKCFIEGYEKILGSKAKEEVLAKVREIRLRGRYVEERRLRREELP